MRKIEGTPFEIDDLSEDVIQDPKSHKYVSGHDQTWPFKQTSKLTIHFKRYYLISLVILQFH